MRPLLEKKIHTTNSKEVRKLKSRFPAAVRTKSWPEMVRLADSGRFDDAFAMGVKMEKRNKQILQQNVTGRRFRVERVELISRMAQADRDLKIILQNTTGMIVPMIYARANGGAGLIRIKERIREAVVIHRREIKKWMNRLLRDAAGMGLKHKQAAHSQIFKDNREGVLQEARLSFSLDKDFVARNKPEIDETSDKWSGITQGILDDNAAEVIGGMDLAQRIYEMTDQTRKELDRLVSDGISVGRSAENIARDIQDYMSPRKWIDENGLERLPKGAYYSPYKNAYRLARTETASVYTKASMAFSKDKWWITGVMYHVTPDHDWDLGCECEDHDGEVMTPEEFEALVPTHPHCMCFSTDVIDPSVFGEDEEGNPVDEN